MTPYNSEFEAQMTVAHKVMDKRRAGLAVTEVFLETNGCALMASDADCVTTCLPLAAGDLAEDQLARWIAAHLGAVGGT